MNTNIGTKRNIIIISIFSVVMLFLIIMFAVSMCSKLSPQEETPTVTRVNKNFSLPSIADVDVNKQPLMYDFLYGTSNWHTSVNVPSLTSNVVIMICHDINEDRYYVTVNLPAENNGGAGVPPNFANAPLEIESLTSTNDKDFNSKTGFRNNLLQYSNIVKEDKFEFSGLYYDTFDDNGNVNNGTGGFTNSNTGCGIVMSEYFYNYEKSGIQKNIDLGYGIDTAYLRAKEASNIARYHWNINDKFWDDINYGCHIKCKKIKDVEPQPDDGYVLKGDFLVLTPTFDIIDANNVGYYYKVNNLSDPKLEGKLESHGYQSVDSAVQNPTYLSQESVNQTVTLGI